MSTANYTNAAQQRILKLLSLLAGHEVHGLLPGKAALDLGCSASAATRDLDNLRTAGLAERLEDTGGWRLSPQIVQLSVRHGMAMQRAQGRLDETVQRYSRT